MNIAVPLGPGVKGPTQFINTQYLKYLKKAKLNPVTISMFSDEATLAAGDGLLLPGGIDVDPIYYLTDNEDSNYCNPDRDEFERKLIQMYVKAGKPIFGICRGLQLLFLEYVG